MTEAETGLTSAAIIVYSVGCAFWAQKLMRDGGRSPGAGFGLGFFFNIIGVIIAAILTDTRRKEVERQADEAPVLPPVSRSAQNREAIRQGLRLPNSQPSMKTCPDCAEEVRAEARICRFCRHEFAPA